LKQISITAVYQAVLQTDLNKSTDLNNTLIIVAEKFRITYTHLCARIWNFKSSMLQFKLFLG